MMSRFWKTASAVPSYHWVSETRWLAGRMSKLSLRSGRKKSQPRCRWRISECALYCVATPMRRMPEFSAFDSAKSIIRVLPPKKTAGLARRSVSYFSRLPRPPASTYAMASRARGLALSVIAPLLLFRRPVSKSRPGGEFKPERGEGRDDDHGGDAVGVLRRDDASGVAHAAAAVALRVGIDDLAPLTRGGQRQPIGGMRVRGEI